MRLRHIRVSLAKSVETSSVHDYDIINNKLIAVCSRHFGVCKKVEQLLRLLNGLLLWAFLHTIFKFFNSQIFNVLSTKFSHFSTVMYFQHHLWLNIFRVFTMVKNFHNDFFSFLRCNITRWIVELLWTGFHFLSILFLHTWKILNFWTIFLDKINKFHFSFHGSFKGRLRYSSVEFFNFFISTKLQTANCFHILLVIWKSWKLNYKIADSHFWKGAACLAKCIAHSSEYRSLFYKYLSAILLINWATNPMGYVSIAHCFTAWLINAYSFQYQHWTSTFILLNFFIRKFIETG